MAVWGGVLRLGLLDRASVYGSTADPSEALAAGRNARDWSSPVHRFQGNPIGLLLT